MPPATFCPFLNEECALTKCTFWSLKYSECMILNKVRRFYERYDAEPQIVFSHSGLVCPKCGVAEGWLAPSQWCGENEGRILCFSCAHVWIIPKEKSDKK